MFDIYDWIGEMRSNQRVLDVGAGAGSFPHAAFTCQWLALDDDPAAYNTEVRYQRLVGASHQLPVRDASIDLVICHHALEHLPHLSETLNEMARVLKPEGRCYISIPNGYGLCDAVYRYVFDGGGHVNRFRRDQIVTQIESTVGVRLTACQTLYSSFVYLRRLVDFDGPLPIPRKIPRPVIAFSQRVLYTGTRLIDRFLGTGLSVYGWAFFFERQPSRPFQSQPGFINVCPNCGTGQSAETAPRIGLLSTRCPNCNQTYPHTYPFPNAE